MIKICKIKSKNPFTLTKIPEADYVINQYVGCQYACKYCYAKFMCKYYPYGKWGSWIVVKENLPELIKNKYIFGKVCMSTVSDPYQPIEKELKLTRRILENMNKSIYLSILTKSDLILRDIDLFAEFKNIEVGLTMNSWDSNLRKKIEPGALDMNKRLTALQVLKENGIKTFCFISPVIPGITDFEAIIQETKEFTDFYFVELLNLKHSGKEFVLWLQENFPESYSLLNNKRKLRSYISNITKYFQGLNLKKIITHF